MRYTQTTLFYKKNMNSSWQQRPTRHFWDVVPVFCFVSPTSVQFRLHICTHAYGCQPQPLFLRGNLPCIFLSLAYNFLSRLDRLVSEPQGSACLSFPSAGIISQYISVPTFKLTFYQWELDNPLCLPASVSLPWKSRMSLAEIKRYCKD